MKASKLYLDCETTGIPQSGVGPLDPSQPDIVQLAYIFEGPDGRVLNRHSSYVFTPKEINRHAQEVHGIDRIILDQWGLPAHEVLGELASEAADADIIVGHNIAFDIKVIDWQAQRIGMPAMLGSLDVECTKKIAKVLVPNAVNTLAGIHSYLFEDEFEDAHDAWADVVATRNVYLKMCELTGYAKPEAGHQGDADGGRGREGGATMKVDPDTWNLLGVLSFAMLCGGLFLGAIVAHAYAAPRPMQYKGACAKELNELHDRLERMERQR